MKLLGIAGPVKVSSKVIIGQYQELADDLVSASQQQPCRTILEILRRPRSEEIVYLWGRGEGEKGGGGSSLLIVHVYVV